MLFAEGGEWLVGNDQEENWLDREDGYIDLEGHCKSLLVVTKCIDFAGISCL